MRKGKFTASEIWKLFVEPRSKTAPYSETAYNYILEKAIEETTGYRKRIVSKEMEHGIISEKDAFDSFVTIRGEDWKYTGDQFFKINENCGASPDAVLYNDLNAVAVCDFKCPQPFTFFEEKVNKSKGGEINRNYFYQLQMQMMATDTDVAYLVYYLASEFGNTFTGEVEYEFKDIPLEERIFYIQVEKDLEVHQKILEKVEWAEKLKQEICETIRITI